MRSKYTKPTHICIACDQHCWTPLCRFCQRFDDPSITDAEDLRAHIRAARGLGAPTLTAVTPVYQRRAKSVSYDTTTPIPAGTQCATMLQRGKFRMVGYSRLANAPTKVREEYKQCPNMAVVWKNGEPRCSAHGKPPRN